LANPIAPKLSEAMTRKQQWEKDFDEKADEVMDSGISCLKLSFIFLVGAFLLTLAGNLIASGDAAAALVGIAILGAFIYGYFESKN
jgi:hypothetical protein